MREADTTSRWKPSRRTLLTAGGSAIFGAVAGIKINEIYQDYQERPYYYSYNEYVKGFPRKSGEYRQRLSSAFESRSSFLFLALEESTWRGSFVADPQKLYGLQVNGVFDPNISLQPVLVSVGDQQPRLAPIIQSEKYATCPVYVGEMDGEQEVAVQSLDGERVPRVTVQVTEMTGDPYTRGVIRDIPDLFIRKDNEDDPTNDMPLKLSYQLRENWFGLRMAEYFMTYSAESNTHVPYPLADEGGRVFDYDPVAIFKKNRKGENLEEAIMVENHFIKMVGQHPDAQVLPWGERRRYQSVEKNNMVSDHIETNISCSFIPDEFLDLPHDVWVDREMGVNVLSIREYIKEGKLAVDDPLVLWMIENEWGGHNFAAGIHTIS